MFFGGADIDVAQIQQSVSDGEALLIDVRSSAEYAASHAAGAVHLDVERIMAGERPADGRAKKLYLYCASGNRSGLAKQLLDRDGYHAENIGGLIHWQRAGGEIVQ